MADVAQQPTATRGMVISNDKDRDHDDDENPPTKDDRRKWSYGLFSCLAPRTCLFAFFCPCVLYGKNLKRYRHLDAHGTPDPTNGEGFCNSDCATEACLSYCCCCCGFVLLMGTRRNIRARYNIKGDAGEDCCTACCCGACGLTQESRELEHEERRYHRERGREIPSNEEQLAAELPAIPGRLKSAIPSWGKSKVQAQGDKEHPNRGEQDPGAEPQASAVSATEPQPSAAPGSQPSAISERFEHVIPSWGKSKVQAQGDPEHPNNGEQGRGPESPPLAASARFGRAIPSWATSKTKTAGDQK